MTEEVYTKQELESKITKFDKWTKRSLITVLFGGGIIMSAAYFTVTMPTKSPRTHQDIKETLYLVEKEQNKLEKGLNFSYNIPELNEFEKVSNLNNNLKTHALEKASKRLYKDLAEFESSSEFIKYKQKRDSKNYWALGLMGTGFLTSLGGLFGATMSRKKEMKYEDRLKNL